MQYILFHRLSAENGSAVVSENVIIIGNEMNVGNGGTADDTTVNSGGSMHVSSGGTANHTTVNSGGRMRVYSGGKMTGALEIASGAIVWAEDGSIIDFDVSARSAESPALVNNFALISGNPTYTITVSATQADGTYSLAGGAADFTGTASIGTDGSNYGTLTVNGAALNYGDYTFTLATSDSRLLLTVSGGPEPAPGGIAGDLNADGRADIVMTITEVGHGAEGATGAWLIQDDQTAAWGDLSQRNPGWEIFGTGKTVAGKKTDDVYIRSTDNVIGAWTTADDGKVNGWETIGEFSADTQIIGLGDFNGDGKDDLRIRTSAGDLGTQLVMGEDNLVWKYYGSVGSEWSTALAALA